jgi:hypothetical protein
MEWEVNNIKIQNMKFEELIDEEMYALVAPDGFMQLSTMAPDFPMCVAMCEMMAKAGISLPLHEMLEQGFMILPIKITAKLNGDENSAFKKKNK